MESLNLNNTTLIHVPPLVRVCVDSLVKGSILFSIQPLNDDYGNSVYSLYWSHIYMLTSETVDLVATNLDCKDWRTIWACRIGIMFSILLLNIFAYKKDQYPIEEHPCIVDYLLPEPLLDTNRSLTPTYNGLMKCIMKLFELVILVNVGVMFFRGKVLMPSIISIFYIALLVKRYTDLMPEESFYIGYVCLDDTVFAITRVIILTGNRQKIWLSYCAYTLPSKILSNL